MQYKSKRAVGPGVPTKPSANMYSQNTIAHYNPSGSDSNRRLRGAPSLKPSAFLRAPRETSIPLPYHRLSPLINHEEPLPDVPFAMKLATVLMWGEWRLFPTPGALRQRTNDAFLMAATLPGVEELLMMIDTTGHSAHQIMKIRPQEKGAAVSVSDVIVAAEGVWHNTQQFVSAGGFAPSFARNRDGKLFWRGLKVEEDDNGALILVLRV